MAGPHKISSSSRHGQGHGHGWSAFDLVKPFPPTPVPDSLMADIDAAIAASELAHSTALLLSKSPQQQNQRVQAGSDEAEEEAAVAAKNQSNNLLAAAAAAPVNNVYDARLADEAYKAACTALASGRHDGALRSLRIAIASCPPDKTSALSKLQSLMAIAESQQQQKQKQQQ